MSEKPLLYEKRQDGVALITFNRPERLNAMNAEMMEGFVAALEDATSDASVRCVALTGTGRAFSAGGDVKAMAESRSAVTGGGDNKDDAARRLAESGWATSGTLYTMPKPTVALVNGFAMGAMLSVALSCDIRFCSDQAKFGTAFRNVALSGDYGGSWFLPRLVGTSRARELYFTGEIVDAQRALELGIANRVVPHEEFMEKGLEFCAQIASGPPLAIGRMKMNLVRADSMPLRDAFFAEALHHTLSSYDEDHANATKAFVNKETPVFQGR